MSTKQSESPLLSGLLNATKLTCFLRMKVAASCLEIRDFPATAKTVVGVMMLALCRFGRCHDEALSVRTYLARRYLRSHRCRFRLRCGRGCRLGRRRWGRSRSRTWLLGGRCRFSRFLALAPDTFDTGDSADREVECFHYFGVFMSGVEAPIRMQAPGIERKILPPTLSFSFGDRVAVLIHFDCHSRSPLSTPILAGLGELTRTLHY